MPLFISDEELRLLDGDVASVAERADAAIRDLRRQLDTVRAESDAAAIAAEQTCALLEQRFSALSADFDRSQAELAELAAAADRRAADLAASQTEKHQLHIRAISKDGEIERLTLEVAELQKSKRQSLELIEQRDTEIREKNVTIQSYLDKIVNLTDVNAGKEARLHEIEVELTHCHATCNRITQEKELLAKHNIWLNEELNVKVKSLAEIRRSNMDEEAKMSAKIADLERERSESSSSLRRSKERIAELEQRISYLEKELCASKDTSTANEQRLGAELSTVTKLAELHKESSEEWSKKAGELEGVIKALETHLTQVEDEYKEKLEKEALVRKELEKEATELKQKLEKCEAEMEKARKSNELNLLPLTSFPSETAYLADTSMKELLLPEAAGYRVDQNDQMIVPKIPSGVSGTALAASLLRDGWSLAKIYEKYQEAADALHHERWGRKHAEAVLERVLREIEEKAELILDERAEHERMVEAYSLMNKKLEQALLEHGNFENTIRNLKSELKRRERDYSLAQKEIDDLQKQVSVLLKECQDIQLRCGSSQLNLGDSSLSTSLINVDSSAEKALHGNMTFKDINGLVQQNVQLRNQVRVLSSELEDRDAELRESFQTELQKVSDEAASKVNLVAKRSEEQGNMIESLHRSVAMYKRLYEEEHKSRTNSGAISKAIPDGKKDLMLLFEGSQEVSKKAYEQVAERARNLEEELSKLRNELGSLRIGRDKAVLEADFARERLDSFRVELEYQRKEACAVSARNAELMHLLVDHEKKIREISDSLQTSEENSRKLSMEVCILKNEKEILVKSEKRALDEVHNLTERVHRLQSSLDTIQTAGEVKENARMLERRTQEENIKRLERDWAELKKECQEEKDRVRIVTLDKEKAVESSMKQVEEMRKELADAWRTVASAESRAAVAEAKCSDLEGKVKGRKILFNGGGHESSTISSNEVNEELWKVKEGAEKLREEAEANKTYMLQYKEIAHSNEVALKQIESAHQEYKTESEISKKTLEDEVLNLRNELSELEKKYVLKSQEATTAIEAKEKEILSLMNEISVSQNEVHQKVAQIETLEIQLSSLQNALDEEHRRWRSAQDNYERQVILQSETIKELTNTSKQLSSLQHEVVKLHETADAQKAENDALRTSWEHGRLELQKERDEAQENYNEINEQNKILHNRLEALHIRLAEKEHRIAGYSSQTTDSRGENDLHNVISYLRRSKEIAETEISLLKQEKSRLQYELQSSLKSSEEAQALLRAQADSARTTMFNHEEFKSLQLQVREVSLLRESNVQLREENKHNFEECQKLWNEVQKARVEAERLHNLLLEKQVEAEAHQKEIEMQKLEIENLKTRIAELVENATSIDLKEYEHMKDELQATKTHLRENGAELVQTKNLVLEKQEFIKSLEEKLAKCLSELDAQGNKFNELIQTQSTLQLEIDRQKKLFSNAKRKNEMLTKEKEELTKEKQGLLKQIEELKSGRKTSSEIDQAAKEKDARIQTLEKMLERERDDCRKEKAKRLKIQNTIVGAVDKVHQEKKKVEETIQKHRQAIAVLIQKSGITNSQLQPDDELDKQIIEYLTSIEMLEDTAKSVNDGVGGQSLPADTLTVDASAAATGRQVTAPQLRPPVPQVKAKEERTMSTLLKPSTEVRRSGRRFVRPSLERTEEPQVDTEMSTAEGTTGIQEGKTGSSHEPETSGGVSSLQPLTRKRVAPLLQPREAAVQGEAGNDVAPPLKKTKEEPAQGTSESKTVLSSAEDLVIVQDTTIPSIDNLGAQLPIEEIDTDLSPTPPNEEIVEAEREEDIAGRDQIEEQLDAPVGTQSQENEVNFDSESTLDDLPPKSRTADESIDEGQDVEDAKEQTQQVAADDEDEREEGELMPDEPEQQQEDTALVESHQESTPGDLVDVGEETGNAFRAASPETLTERSDVDISEEIGEGDHSTDRAAVEPDQSSQVVSGGQEGSPSRLPEVSPQVVREASPSPVPATAASEQQNSSTSAVEGDETPSHRTINLHERAKQNRLARIQGQLQPPAPRGRRGTGSRGTARGPRGRGGRGQA